jgi:NADPH:quinone reductase-like Zn-dependent oxidoreductase
MFSIQIAKAFGGEVTAVCSTKNMDFVRSLGADHVIDYTREDFTKGNDTYDLIIDIVANRSIQEYSGVLSQGGTYVAVAFNASALFLGPILSRTSGKRFRSLVVENTIDDLVVLRELIEAGKVTPVIERKYRLIDTPTAFKEYHEKHPSGKAVIVIAPMRGAL